MSPELIRSVWQRAGGRCEYCHVPGAARRSPFQIDHIIAKQHGGLTEPENLALCCIHCNRFKGPNIAGFDLVSRQVVRLFHPRQDIWTEHLEWNDDELSPLTAVGRVTISVLFVNDPEAIVLRKALRQEGVFPL